MKPVARPTAPIEIKAVAPKRQRRAAKPHPVPAAELTDLEIRAALAVRRLPPKKKEGWVEVLEKLAAKYEFEAAAARPVRTLRLVIGGAQ